MRASRQAKCVPWWQPTPFTPPCRARLQGLPFQARLLPAPAGTTTNLSFLAFWIQFALSLVSAGILLFSVAFVPRVCACTLHAGRFLEAFQGCQQRCGIEAVHPAPPSLALPSCRRCMGGVCLDQMHTRCLISGPSNSRTLTHSHPAAPCARSCSKSPATRCRA